jgi:hypothetical protein
LAGDDAVALQGTQPIGEELARNARQTADEVGESPRARGELAHQQQGPPVAGDVERACQGAVLLVAMLSHWCLF